MKKEFHLTREGIQKLREELKALGGKRFDVASKLKAARSQGDLAENSEYQTAREEQVQIEQRASEIEHILTNVEEIKSNKKSSKVILGSSVKLKDGASGDREFSIVGSVEANPAENKISDESPIGQALLGKKVGDKVEIELPAGKKTYTIKSIS